MNKETLLTEAQESLLRDILRNIIARARSFPNYEEEKLVEENIYLWNELQPKEVSDEDIN